MDLFDMVNGEDMAPLAQRMRPKSLDEFLGQEHLLAEGCLLRRAIEANRLTSCIFYGPPGCGKTSLAKIISSSCNASFEQLNAVTAGVAEVRQIITQARQDSRLYGRATYLLLDECHRWSKAQSDALLPAMEDGTIRLIGSTTENPNIAMTPAILSRCMIFQFYPLTPEHIKRGLRRAIEDRERGFGNMLLEVSEDALEHLVYSSGGDIRAAYNGLELAVLSQKPDFEGRITVDLEAAEQSLQQKSIACDESTFYDYLSAFCKSLRGSDVDAALFWACRMLRAGVDPRIVARRLMVHASEDVGLADPMAMLQAQAALISVEKIGMPECLLNLGQAIAYVCAAPKSNSALAVHAAWAAAAETVEVPKHLRDTHYKGHETLGSGEGYKYPHEYKNHYVSQQYLPDALAQQRFFEFSDQGAEQEMKKYNKRIREEAE
ncbi:MAG: replication-associated recombination protein A [Clostridia bacterium]|nr:replication-associated recombination protein A [Clostridia bacterium]